MTVRKPLDSEEERRASTLLEHLERLPKEALEKAFKRYRAQGESQRGLDCVRDQIAAAEIFEGRY